MSKNQKPVSRPSSEALDPEKHSHSNEGFYDGFEADESKADYEAEEINAKEK